ncbi:MAG TPA: CAP domain-containing protein [Polyangiaceae bacterium]
MNTPALLSPIGIALVGGLLLLGAGCRPKPWDAPLPKPTAGPLTLEDAREYVLSLVNRDRAEHALSPVERDRVAERAGQRHVEDMTRHGFTAHWGTDGSLLEERYTAAGGQHMVHENTACFADAQRRNVDRNPLFEAALLERIQNAFMAELPPDDGHRRNILKPVHNRVGIGLAKPVGIAEPCMAQEFVDAYGEFEELPGRATVGQPVTVSGEVHEPVKFGGVGIARVEPAQPISPKDLLPKKSYVLPQPYVMYFPPGFETPKPVAVTGSRFTITVPLNQGGRPGRYEISVWGRYPGGGDALVMISVRTIDATR